MARHPIRVVVADDLGRSRLTVFFRLLLAIPHYVWFGIWTIGAVVVAVPTWVLTLVRGRPPGTLHDFLSRYVRYSVHLHAYLSLAANPYPAFTGREGRYPVDVEIDGPGPQSRWQTAFRLLLAVPAVIVAAAFLRVGTAYRSSDQQRSGWEFVGAGVVPTIAFLAWFACLARGRITRGFRDLLVYGLRYGAQAEGYLFLVTDRYPDASPGEVPGGDEVPAPPILLQLEQEERRSRLTVFFRLLLVLPHLVWLLLWSLVILLAAVAGWLITLVLGRLPADLHRFFSAYLRYQTHVTAFLYLIGSPFPGFTGRQGSYPVDLGLPEPERQSRWLTGFRLFLAVPALVVSTALSSLLLAAAFLGWFASLATARMPGGLERMGAFAIRYQAQVNGYLLFLTDRYPYSGPWLAADAGP